MGAYLSARESAVYCGVSEKTIRNWITAGRLSAEKSAGSFRIAQVDLDVLRSGTPHPPRGAESAPAEIRADVGPQGADSAPLAGMVALVDRLTVENRQLAESAAMWQERAGSLADQLGVAREEIKALTAPQAVEIPTAAPAPIRPLYVRLWPVMAILLAIVAAGALVAWPR